MELPDVFARYRPHIDAKLKDALAGGDLTLYQMLRYHMGWLDEEFRPAESNAGKAVRPALCLFACEAVGGDWPQALPAAAAIELIHNFSLIHDDIQDGDTERRHRPTVWYRWGHSQGINAGAALNVLGHLAMFPDGAVPQPAATALEVSRILTNACVEMIEGQVLDLNYEQRRSISVDDYLLMIGKKTGALLESSLHIGAVIGSQDKAVIEGMRSFGKGIGLLFQVRDDCLGVWGEEEATGKPAASDLHRRKKSLPVVHALWNANNVSSAERFAEIYGSKDPLSEQDVADLFTILDEVKSYEFCQGIAREQSYQALEALDGIELSPSAREECEELATFLLEREY